MWLRPPMRVRGRTSLTATNHLDKRPFFRGAVERVRRQCRIESIGIVLHARFGVSLPEDLSARLRELPSDELKEMLGRSAIAATAEEALAVQLKHLRSVDVRTRPGGEQRPSGMSEVTYYVALPLVAADDGIAAGEAVECFNPSAVVMKADALSRRPGHVGAVAFSRTGDPATGDFGDATVMRKFGEVPDDPTAL